MFILPPARGAAGISRRAYRWFCEAPEGIILVQRCEVLVTSRLSRCFRADGDDLGEQVERVGAGTPARVDRRQQIQGQIVLRVVAEDAARQFLGLMILAVVQRGRRSRQAFLERQRAVAGRFFDSRSQIPR